MLSVRLSTRKQTQEVGQQVHSVHSPIKSAIWHMTGTGTPSLNATVELPLLWEWAVMRPGRDTAASVTGCVHQAFMSSESNFRKVSVGSCHTRLGLNILRERANLKTESRMRIMKEIGWRSGRGSPIGICCEVSRVGARLFFRPSINLRMTVKILTLYSTSKSVHAHRGTLELEVLPDVGQRASRRDQVAKRKNEDNKHHRTNRQKSSIT
jgi:hypothetical protein